MDYLELLHEGLAVLLEGLRTAPAGDGASARAVTHDDSRQFEKLYYTRTGPWKYVFCHDIGPEVHSNWYESTHKDTLQRGMARQTRSRSTSAKER